jgi:hypothetical protein
MMIDNRPFVNTDEQGANFVVKYYKYSDSFEHGYSRVVENYTTFLNTYCRLSESFIERYMIDKKLLNWYSVCKKQTYSKYFLKETLLNYFIRVKF